MRFIPAFFRMSVFAVGVCLASVPAQADVFDTLDSAIESVSSAFDFIWPDDVGLEDFSFKLGAGTGISPDYSGSDNYEFRIIPLIEVKYRNVLVWQGSKIRFNVLNHENVRAGPLVNYLFGRDENENPVLRGLGEISDTAQVGGFVEANYEGTVFSADIRKALGAGQGTRARAILAQVVSFDDRRLVAVALRGDWASETAMQTNYGITATQSANSGLRPFDADGGIEGLGAHLVGRYKFNEKWRIEGIVSYQILTGDAADSPLVDDVGSRHQFVTGVGFRFSF